MFDLERFYHQGREWRLDSATTMVDLSLDAERFRWIISRNFDNESVTRGVRDGE